MNRVVSVLLLSLLLHAGHASPLVTSSSAQNKSTERDRELVCELSLPSEVRSVDGYFNTNLVITNISDHLIRICTLTQGWRFVGRTDYTEVLRPDFWKSDRPKPEEFPDHVVAIEPGKSISIPLKIRYYDEIVRGHPLTISVGYETESEFAKRYGTWSGSIRSKPVMVNVIE
jgi:hypothetical protein